MYAVSTAFQTAVQSPQRELKARCTVAGVTYTTDSNALMDIYYTHGVIGDKFTIGQTPAAYIELQIKDITGNFDGNAVTLEIGVDIDGAGTYEYCPMGQFVVEETVKSTTYLTLRCYDAMVKLETPFTSTSTSASAILTDIMTGFTHAITLPSYLTALTLPVLKNRTKRQVLGYIAAMMGGFAYVDRAGTFRIKTNPLAPATSPKMIINGDKYFSLNKEDLASVVQAVSIYDGSKQVTSGTVTTGVWLYADTPYVTSATAANIESIVDGLPIQSYKCIYIGNPALELGDNIQIDEYVDESTTNTFYVNVGEIELKFSGYMESTIYNVGDGKTKSNYATNGELISRFGNISADNITTGTLTADRIKGGTLTLGGITNQYGQIVLRNSSDTYNLLKVDYNGFLFQDSAAETTVNINNLQIYHKYRTGSGSSLIHKAALMNYNGIFFEYQLGTAAMQTYDISYTGAAHLKSLWADNYVYSAKIGAGKPNPSYKIHLLSDTSYEYAIDYGPSNEFGIRDVTAGSWRFMIDTSGNSFLVNTLKVNTDTAQSLTLVTNTAGQNNGGSILFAGNDGVSTDRSYALIKGAKENTTSGNYASYLAFQTRAAGSGSLSERARIDSTGNVLVGYTTSNGASYKLQVNSQIFATSSTIATSDGRYKENVKQLENALDIVNRLNPVQFNWKKHVVHNFDVENTTTGFIAQEVLQSLDGTEYSNAIVKRNECEYEDSDGNIVKEEFLGIAEGNLIAILTKALQELNAKVDALR